MSEKDYAPLSIACVRGLCDKLYDKRKFAGVEIEKMVKDFNEAGNASQLARLIRVLGQELMASTNPNVKNGALMGLSSVAVGLGKDVSQYLAELLVPMAACASEGDARVRYQAAEALYNVVKVARDAALAHFALVFEALARLAADPELQVRHAAELLDRLLKDVVTASGCVRVDALVALLRERGYARGSAARHFLAGWVCVLDAVPHVDLLPHLHELLDPLLRMLDDPSADLRRVVDVQLAEFLRSLCAPQAARVPLGPLLAIAVTHAGGGDERAQRTAVAWLRALGTLPHAAAPLRAQASGVLHAVLPALALDDSHPTRREIRESALAVNQQLTALVTADEGAAGSGGDDGLDVAAVVAVLTRLATAGAVPTKEAALEWLLALYARRPRSMAPHAVLLFPAALHGAADPHAGVVRRCLALLADICSADGELESSAYYDKFLQALLRLFAADETMLEDRGPFIVRQLCVLVGAERVLVPLARAVRAQCAPPLAAAVVDMLSAILLTAAELHELRQRLRRFNLPATRALFTELYPCWAHSAVPLLALCLLTHNYHHCNRLIDTFGDLEITVDFLTEVDKLVQLIESPIFAYLRLELLDAGSGRLRRALYGLLMLLPQGEAFTTLRRRLQCAPPLPHDTDTRQQDTELEELLQEFVRVQAVHRAHRLHADT